MDDESVRTLDTLCITHPVQPSTTTLLSTHRIAHHTTTQSAAIRESIVSPVATGGRHKHPPSPQSHARAPRCGLAQACAAAARCALRADVIMWVVSGGPGSRLPGDRAYGVMPNKLLYTSVTRGSSRQSGQCQAMRPSYNASADAGRSSHVGRRSRPTRQAARDQRRRDERTDGYRRTRSGARL